MPESYRCGHPKTAENSRMNGGYLRCRICQNRNVQASKKRRLERAKTDRIEVERLREENARLREQLQQCLNGRVA